jgi:uncharacterized protein (TIGR04255 family)
MSTREDRPLPSFERPPLAEVAAGIQFAPLSLRLVDIAAVHQLYAADYPISVDQPPIMPAFETFGAAAPLQPPLFFPVAGPPWRTWFVSPDEEHVIQFQLDRLLANWRIRADGQPYPRYAQVKGRFVKALQKLIDFLDLKRLPGPQINQCELTYYNKIPLMPEETFADIERVIGGVDLAGRQRPGAPFTEAAFTVARVLSTSSGVHWGRLSVECAPGFEPNGRRVWNVNITVRGRPFDDRTDGVLLMLDTAHVEIVTTFANVTTTKMHQEWGRLR